MNQYLFKLCSLTPIKFFTILVVKVKTFDFNLAISTECKITDNINLLVHK